MLKYLHISSSLEPDRPERLERPARRRRPVLCLLDDVDDAVAVDVTDAKEAAEPVEAAGETDRGGDADRGRAGITTVVAVAGMLCAWRNTMVGR